MPPGQREPSWSAKWWSRWCPSTPYNPFMRVYLNLFGGVAGDMLVAGLLDAGAPEAVLQEVLHALPQEGQEWSIGEDLRHGIRGKRFCFSLPQDSHHHRHLPEIVAMVDALPLKSRAKAWAHAAFAELAAAEAQAHGVPVEEIHFHEVGALDALADICGACALLDALDPSEVWASPVAVGSGAVTCAHGQMPVPAPGSLYLLQGMPQEGFDLEGERATPTGLALLRAWGVQFGRRSAAVSHACGYGLGTRQPQDRPNLLRVEIEQPCQGPEWLVQLSCLADDVTGEVLGDALDQLHAEGAIDAFAVPAVAKKGRPAYEVVVLAQATEQQAMAASLLRLLGGLGLRIQAIERHRLARRMDSRESPWGPWRVKQSSAEEGGQVWHEKPEFADVQRLAEETGLSPREVLLRTYPPRSAKT